MTPENRLTQKLTDLESRCFRLEEANEVLEAENQKLASVIERITNAWEVNLVRKAADQHERFQAVETYWVTRSTEGDNLDGETA